MKILSIETSCDETAVSIVSYEKSNKRSAFKVLGNSLYSQTKIHEKYGGVFPNLAKREHQKNLAPLLVSALKQSRMYKSSDKAVKNLGQIMKILEREPELSKQFLENTIKISKPNIGAIAVTYGPGLEPALWVGINFAKALGKLWNLPVIPINHMEGHIASVLYKQNKYKLPAIALLISGGHTELVITKKEFIYKKVGGTRDDAVGESFDKVARMLSLPYPGGPEVSKLANIDRKKTKNPDKKYIFPRPMIGSSDLDFSFSGLKTSVLYKVRDEKKLTNSTKEKMARGFEDAVIDVLITKTRKAINKFKPKTLIVAGGVIANKTLRKKFEYLNRDFPNLDIRMPEKSLSTDNSVMIAIAALTRIAKDSKILKRKFNIKADGGAEYDY